MCQAVPNPDWKQNDFTPHSSIFYANASFLRFNCLLSFLLPCCHCPFVGAITQPRNLRLITNVWLAVHASLALGLFIWMRCVKTQAGKSWTFPSHPSHDFALVGGECVVLILICCFLCCFWLCWLLRIYTDDLVFSQTLQDMFSLLWRFARFDTYETPHII